MSREKSRSWGKSILRSYGHMGEFFRCPMCDNFLGNSSSRCLQYAVGFTDNPRYSKWRRPGDEGAVIIECPKCFKNFWFHFPEHLLRGRLEQLINENPNFLKVPGAKEAFLTSIEKEAEENE